MKDLGCRQGMLVRLRSWQRGPLLAVLFAFQLTCPLLCIEALKVPKVSECLLARKQVTLRFCQFFGDIRNIYILPEVVGFWLYESMNKRTRRRGELIRPTLIVKKWLNIKPDVDEFSQDESDNESYLDDDDSSSVEKDPVKDNERNQTRFRCQTSGTPSKLLLRRLRRHKSETLRVQYIDTKEIKVSVGTWNVAGRLPPDDLEIDNWLGIKEPADIYVLGRVIWFGDLNYRLNLTDRATRELVAAEEWEDLISKDQLRREMHKGRVFDGWHEGSIDFGPTYKYEFNSDKYFGVDSKPGEKKRTPAWCDRILWFGKGMKQLSYTRAELMLSDHRPVNSLFLVEIEIFSHRKLQKALTITDAELEDE